MQAWGCPYCDLWVDISGSLGGTYTSVSFDGLENGHITASLSGTRFSIDPHHNGPFEEWVYYTVYGPGGSDSGALYLYVPANPVYPPFAG